ncbi:hydroxyacid dehydrogenase [Kineococcus sp. SYSU DK001]|uniref:hydroxyacid dehydrogenase n=1 Tax=Kineococcus sp. SYSU DK001 TaxID=3383122 RepID=UPI003D7DDD5B
MKTTAQAAPLVVASIIGPQWRTSVLDARARSTIAEHAALIDLDRDALLPLAGSRDEASRARVLITGWGTPPLDASVLDRFPALELVAHAAGTVRGIVGEEVWARGLRVCNAADANAVSVADFTVAQIHLSLKNAWRLAAAARGTARTPERTGVRGLDGATVSLVGLGAIGRRVAERLAALDVRVIAFDPFVGDEECAALGVERVDLADAFARADVLTLHAPLTEGTRGMVGRDLLSALPDSATLINTARGGLLDHDVLSAVLADRPDLFALLDVTDPEPLPTGHPLLGLPNTFLTPHIAGSLGSEEARLGALVAGEVSRFARGLPLEHELVEDRVALSA